MFAFIKYLEHIDRSRHLYCHNQYKSDNLQITYFQLVRNFRKLIIYIFLLAHLYERIFITCVAEGESRSRSAVTPSVPKSCHRNSSETTDPIIMKLGM